MPKAGNHFIMSVLDAIGCDRAEDIFNFGEGGDGVISGMIFRTLDSRSMWAVRKVDVQKQVQPSVKSHKQSHLKNRQLCNHSLVWRGKWNSQRNQLFYRIAIYMRDFFLMILKEKLFT